MANDTMPVTHEVAEPEGYSLAKLRKQFQDYAHVKAKEIEEQKQGRRYFHAVQWTAEEVKAIRDRGQPVTTKNAFARKVNAIVGVVERLQQQPKAYPNSPQHMDGAEIATEALRYCLTRSQWDAIVPQIARHMAIDGIGGVELLLEPGDTGDLEIAFGMVQPDTFFYNPRSYEENFSDATFMGTSKWVDREILKSQFPDQAEAIQSITDTGSEFTSDSDREFIWTNSTENSVRAVDHWYLANGEWHWCFHVGSVKLAEGVSPFRDERDQSTSKFIMSSPLIDHEGDRYGFLRNLKTNQDEINQRTSRMLHITNSRRLILEDNAVQDVEATRREWARADGVVVINQGRMDSIRADNTSQDFAGQLALLQEAKQDMETFGPNPELMGDAGRSQSGRAIAMQQQAGLATLGPYILAFKSWKLRVYRAIWNAIQDHWQAERWIRVTDHEGLAQFIQINGLDVDEYGRPALVNAVGSLDVDITLDEGPDTITTMVEAMETLQSAMQAGMQIPPDILLDLLPVRQDIKKRIKERMEQASQPDPMQEQAKQIALQQEQANTAKTVAETGKAKAQTFEIMADAVDTISKSPVAMSGMLNGLGGPEPAQSPQPPMQPQQPAMMPG